MRNHYKRFLKLVVAHALYYSGILWLYAAFKFHRHVVVLMYHRVLPGAADTFSGDAIIVRPATFARQIAFLRRFFRPLSLDQLSKALDRKEPLPSRGCLVTFDDGWDDNFSHALPILRQERVPAVVFVATDYVGSDNCFWQERLSRRMFIGASQGGAPRRLVERQIGGEFERLTPSLQRYAIRSAISRMKAWPRQTIEEFETTLGHALRDCGIDPGATGDDRFMSWERLTALAGDSVVTVGSHACSHWPLTSLSRELKSAELSTSRAEIEKRLSRRVEAIAYPNGNYDEEVVETARQVGYRLGFTTKRGLVSAQDDPLKLRRINIHEGATSTMPEFLCVILGVFAKSPRNV